MDDAAYDLVVLAAGLGSRFGGLKQVAPVGPGGELIVEYSAHDARRAGFVRVVFVIRRDLEQEFRAAVGRRLEGRMEVAYVFQELADLPLPHAPAPGRVKPWGTGHAVLAAEPAVRGPFAVINADDFYGAAAYRALAEHFRGGSRAGGGARQTGVRARGLSAAADPFRARGRQPRHLPDGCGRPADRHRRGDENRAHARRPGAPPDGSRVAGRPSPETRSCR